jgi:pSer/pThr/pTyr-binding forkhead associated (FHA) protein/DNA-binding winged helix-turn-helix (wHTH) protein
MTIAYPVIKATKPNGTQYTIDLATTLNSQANSQERDIYISIGRQSNNDIVLFDPHRTISRHHCSIEYQNFRWWIVDVGSANGTFLKQGLNQPEIDVRSEAKIALKTGDIILILGEINPSGRAFFWQLEFIDPEETVRVSNRKTLPTIEYNLTRQMLLRNIDSRQDSIPLTEQECFLIDYMSRENYANNNQATVCEYEELIQAVWSNNNYGISRKDINHLVWRIRSKIELDSGEPLFLKTVRGKGYLLDILIIE